MPRLTRYCCLIFFLTCKAGIGLHAQANATMPDH